MTNKEIMYYIDAYTEYIEMCEKLRKFEDEHFDERDKIEIMQRIVTKCKL